MPVAVKDLLAGKVEVGLRADQRPALVLAHLREHAEHAFTAAELSRAFDTDHRSMRSVLARLQQRGMVDRKGEHWFALDARLGAEHADAAPALARAHGLAETARLLRGQLPRWEREYGLTRLRIFGSMARGEASATSDLDLLADFSGRPNAFDLAGLKVEIEDLVGRRVDLAMRDGLKPAILQDALRDAVPV